MPLWGVEINGHHYELEVGPGGFELALDRPNRALALFWIRQTQFKNIIWIRITSIGWRWPPIRWVGAFTDTDEPAPKKGGGDVCKHESTKVTRVGKG